MNETKGRRNRSSAGTEHSNALDLQQRNIQRGKRDADRQILEAVR
jgi:hypothetical protein